MSRRLYQRDETLRPWELVRTLINQQFKSNLTRRRIQQITEEARAKLARELVRQGVCDESGEVIIEPEQECPSPSRR